MKRDLRSRAIALRVDKQMSYSQIREKLGVAKSTLSGWLQHYPLDESRIQELRAEGWHKGEAARERFRNSMRKRRVAEELRELRAQRQKLQGLSKQSLYAAGLLLYAAEGAKQDTHRVMVANTNPAIILFFLKWLKDFFGVSSRALRFQLHLYSDMNLAGEERFWQKTLKAIPKQFYKSQIRTTKKGSFTYKESFRHGTCSAYIGSVKIKRQINAGIKALLDLHAR